MQLYKKLQKSKFGVYEPVDFGWRWCKDGLPEEGEECAVILESGDKYIDTYAGVPDGWEMQGHYPVQWCKLPEPLKEGE